MPHVTLPYVVLIGGLIAAVWSSLRIASGVASLRWPSTTGRVRARDIDDTGQRYQLILEYSYEVNGVPYRGRRISFDFPLGRKEFEAGTLLFYKYPPGKEITVYFDPQSPYRSVIERGVSWQLLLSLSVGIGLVAMSTL
jgi:hypothetical protein